MGALPKQVRDQIATANAIIEEMANPTVDAEGKPIVKPDETPPADPPVDPAPAAPVAVVEEPTPDPAPAPEPETIEHKYKVLQGKYNAEVPRMSRQIKESGEVISEMRQRINNTESLLAAMQATRTPAPEPTPVPNASELPVVTPEETEQFGPDLIDLIGRVAAREVIPEIDARVQPLGARIEKTEQSTSQTLQGVARSERTKLLAALAEAVPEWETQNENEVFLGWLNENDPYAGIPRGQLLTNAFNQSNAEVVIAIFKGFQTENAVVAPGEVTPPVDDPSAEPQQKLDDLVAPGTPKTGTTSAPNESGKRVWSRKMISDFYAAKNEIHRKGQALPEEYIALEKDLFLAQTEGRVVNR